MAVTFLHQSIWLRQMDQQLRNWQQGVVRFWWGRDDTTASSRPHQNLTTLLSSEPNNTTPMPVCCVFLCRKGTSVEKISAGSWMLRLQPHRPVWILKNTSRNLRQHQLKFSTTFMVPTRVQKVLHVHRTDFGTRNSTWVTLPNTTDVTKMVYIGGNSKSISNNHAQWKEIICSI